MRPRRCLVAEPIGEPAAERRADHAGQLQEDRRGKGRHNEIELEEVLEKHSHPGQHDNGDEVGANESAEAGKDGRRG